MTNLSKSSRAGHLAMSWRGVSLSSPSTGEQTDDQYQEFITAAVTAFALLGSAGIARHRKLTAEREAITSTRSLWNAKSNYLSDTPGAGHTARNQRERARRLVY